MLHADRNIGLRQRHPKGWTVNNDLIGQETHSRRESFFGLLSQIGVEVKAINDDAAEFLANVHREGKTRLIELPSLKTIDQMNDARVCRESLRQHELQRVVFQRTQLFDLESLLKRKLDGLAEHGSGRNFGVMVVD